MALQLTVTAMGFTAAPLHRSAITQSVQPRYTAPICSAAADGPACVSRRAVAASLAAAAVLRPLPSLADIQAGDGGDGTWAEHTGAFDEKFFKDFKTTDSGFRYKLLNQGAGEKPQDFQKVYVHYTGYLLDGTKFDSSYDKSTPFKFRMNKGKVIVGWESVIRGMQPGQKVIVTIPPQFAYGDKAKGDIPKNSELVFYIELVRLGNIKGDKPRLYGTIGGKVPPADERVDQDED